MEEEFLPYEHARDLKELGFDKPCIAYYALHNVENKLFFDIDPDNGKLIALNQNQFYHNNLSEVGRISAPTWKQAFKFFREKYKLKGFISPVEYLDGTADTYHWCIYNECNSGYDQLTNEEAELECLKKLIDIIKEKK